MKSITAKQFETLSNMSDRLTAMANSGAGEGFIVEGDTTANDMLQSAIGSLECIIEAYIVKKEKEAEEKKQEEKAEPVYVDVDIKRTDIPSARTEREYCKVSSLSSIGEMEEGVKERLRYYNVNGSYEVSVSYRGKVIGRLKINDCFEFAYAACPKLYCNYHIGSDVYPYEVLEVRKGGKELLIRAMDAKCKEPYTNNWEYFSDERREPIVVKVFKNGCYGTNAADKNYSLHTEPIKVYDYSF